MEAGLMKEIVSLNGSGIDGNIPVFKIEVELIEIVFRMLALFTKFQWVYGDS